MPNHQQPPRRSSKTQLWVKRSVHLKTYLQDLPRRLRLDIEALVKIFLARRSLTTQTCRQLPDQDLGVLQGNSTAQVGETRRVGPVEANDPASTEAVRWNLETRSEARAAAA